MTSLFIKLLKHPLIKRLLITILFAAGIGLIWSWLGFEQSMQAGLVLGSAAYFIAGVILLGAGERKLKVKSIVLFIRGNIKTIAKYSILLSSIIFFFSSQEKPSDPMIAQIQNQIEIFGLFIVLMCLITGHIRTIAHGNYSFMMSSMRKVITGLAIYSLTLWAIGQYGVDIKEWMIATPNAAAVVGISLLMFVLMMITDDAPYSYVKDEREGYACRASARFAVTPKLTERDIKYTAAHESGHTLVYASLGSLPPGIELVIKNNGDTDHVLGYISAINSEHRLSEKTFSEWFMLVLLAGKYGESFAFGENTLGSTNDHQRWLSLATTYLSNHFDGIFYSDPKNKFEQELNEEKLEKLQCSQKAMLEILFSKNKPVFESLSSDLLSKRKMGRDDLIPHLSQVTLPENFPLPLGNFNEFGREWPKELGLYTDNDN